MNLFIGCGRLTKDVDLRYSSKDSSIAVARYTLAIDSGYGDKKRTDFIRCIAFGKTGEFASKYFSKGKRVLVEGRLQIGSYENKDKVKIPTADIIVEKQEFADAKSESNAPVDVTDGFTDIVSDEDDDTIPFT